MIVERASEKVRIFGEDRVLTALSKISDNRLGHLVVLSADGRVTGIVTDGDIRRWLMKSQPIDLNISVNEISNPDFVAMQVDAPRAKIAEQLNDRVRLIPLVDEYGHLVSIARGGHAGLRIGERQLGDGHPVFIIAEIGNNHNGDVDLAKRLVDLAAEAGADCAKFQMRDMSVLYTADKDKGEASHDLGTQYTLDLLARYNLSKDQLFDIFDHCRTRGLEPLCTPWDIGSVEALEAYGVEGYKVASADLTNHELLSRIAMTDKTMFCSTGMATEGEIRDSVELLRGLGAPFSLLHVNSTYPTPFKDVNLSYLPRLAEIGDCPVGYSGHERGWFVPVAAVALGACVVEKHFTVDRSMEGNDHKVSLLPDELRAMVEAIRSTEQALGSQDARTITQGEMMNREVLAKSLHAARDVAPGAAISLDDIVVRSPGQGLQPNRLDDLVGRTANRKISAGTPFFPSDLEDTSVGPRAFSFKRPWGIPVRYHDYRKMLEASNVDLLEYHLSYKDMEENIQDWFDAPLDLDFTVHTPELFAGDHILDLASTDAGYLQRSIDELNRVCDLARSLKPYHSRCTRPVIVTNMGGFRTHGFLTANERTELYGLIEENLAQVNAEGLEIIPQTMPPFPWHFGGQSHHNLFVDPDEIADFCQRNQMRICFDLSHSQLACNHYDWSMTEFTEKVGPYTAHLHIADAKGLDGEGLQVGEGDMDFGGLARILDDTCPEASFVPEVWQGHKNDGAGFWYGLDKLEHWFGHAPK